MNSARPLHVHGPHVNIHYIFCTLVSVCCISMAFLNEESLSHSASCLLCVLARFAVHCCVSKLYWHSPRLLLLPHHLRCPPSLPVPLSPDWLTRIFNLSVYISLLCLKQHWQRLRARQRLGRERWRWSWVYISIVGRGEKRRWRMGGRGATKIGWE